MSAAMLEARYRAWGGRLAVVDDEPDLCNMVKLAFEQEATAKRVAVDTFCHPLNFLEEHEKNPYDAVLLDYCFKNCDLPIQDITRRIRKINRLTLLILTSGHFDKASESSMVIAKPYTSIVEQVMTRLEALGHKLPFAREMLTGVVLTCLGESLRVRC